MNRRQIGVKQGHPMSVEQTLNRAEIIVEEMFVINLVKGAVFHNSFH